MTECGRRGGDEAQAFQFRLLVPLTHLRLGTSLRATASMFGIDEVGAGTGVTSRGAAGRPRGRSGWPVRSGADPGRSRRVPPAARRRRLRDHRWDRHPCPRPGSWESQRPAWSGKSHDHVVKGTVVADADGKPDLVRRPTPTARAAKTSPCCATGPARRARPVRSHDPGRPRLPRPRRRRRRRRVPPASPAPATNTSTVTTGSTTTAWPKPASGSSTHRPAQRWGCANIAVTPTPSTASAKPPSLDSPTW